MKRFIITVFVATVLHAVACIFAPPFEFGHNRAQCFFFAFVSGLFGFPVMFAVVLLPLQLGLRRFIAHKMQRTQAIVAGLVLLGLAAAWVFTHPTLPIHHGFYVHWLFWSTVAIAVTISFFWPFGGTARFNVALGAASLSSQPAPNAATTTRHPQLAADGPDAQTLIHRSNHAREGDAVYQFYEQRQPPWPEPPRGRGRPG